MPGRQRLRGSRGRGRDGAHLDLLRALRGADVLPALERELAPARGANAAFDRAAGLVLHSVDQGVHEAQARILARDLALVLQAALLQRQAPAFVFEAFCASRLAATPDVFGLLPAGLDLEALVERALPESDPRENP